MGKKSVPGYERADGTPVSGYTANYGPSKAGKGMVPPNPVVVPNGTPGVPVRDLPTVAELRKAQYEKLEAQYERARLVVEFSPAQDVVNLDEIAETWKERAATFDAVNADQDSIVYDPVTDTLLSKMSDDFWAASEAGKDDMMYLDNEIQDAVKSERFFVEQYFPVPDDRRV